MGCTGVRGGYNKLLPYLNIGMRDIIKADVLLTNTVEAFIKQLEEL